MTALSQSQPSTANAMRVPLVAKASQNVRDAVRWLRSAARAVQCDEATRQYAKNLLSGARAKDVERLLALSLDAVRRGASLERAEMPWRLGLAAVRAFWRAHSRIADETTLAEDHATETAAQWAMESAEIAFRNAPTCPFKARAYIEARSAYIRLSTPLSEEAERIAALA